MLSLQLSIGNKWKTLSSSGLKKLKPTTDSVEYNTRDIAWLNDMVILNTWILCGFRESVLISFTLYVFEDQSMAD